MYEHVEKPKVNKNQNAKASVAQQKSCDEATFHFVDNRSSTVAQRQLQEVANTKELRTKQSVPLQLISSRKVIQRDAFWPVNGQNIVTNSVPVANQPAYPFIKRNGGTQDHELYNGVKKAKESARAQANINLKIQIYRSLRTDQSGNQANGTYIYGVKEQELQNPGNGQYLLPRNVNCVINHTDDDQAELELHPSAVQHQDEDTVNHFHAYEYNQGANIRHQQSNAAQPIGNQRLGREHYFVNPFI